MQKYNAQVRVKGFDMHGNPVIELARIARITKKMLPIPDGYVPVKFDYDGGTLLVHSSHLV